MPFLFSDQEIVLMCTEGSLQFNIIHVPCSVVILQCLFQQRRIFRYYRTVSVLRVSAFFGYDQGGIRQRKIKTALVIMAWMCCCRGTKDVTVYKN
jgi:hypothetical protein